MDKHNLYYIWLGEKLYAGCKSAKVLLEYYKDIEKIYDASKDDYQKLDIPRGDIKRLCDKTLDNAKRYYEYCEKEHIGLITYDSPHYPGRLKSITDPPPLLYYRGRLVNLDDYPIFAMVGTRSCSEQGFRNAYRIAYTAAHHGAVIINGLAKGEDAACITGALDAGGYAIGVLGCGIDRIYPAENKELFIRLSSQGLIITEFPPFSTPDGKNFPIRNRVMSGLSLASAIFEADEGSGALHTASHALAQGRKLFALPGDINNSLYSGPLALIKDGAQMFTNAYDILSEYSLMFPHRINLQSKCSIPEKLENEAVEKAFTEQDLKKNIKTPQKTLKKQTRYKDISSGAKSTKSKSSDRKDIEKPVCKNENAVSEPLTQAETDTSVLSPSELILYKLFEKHDTLTIDEIAASGIGIDDVLSSLTLLEIYGFVVSLPGGRFQRK